MIIERFVCGRAGSNAYLFAPDGDGDCLIVDAGVGAAGRMRRRIDELGLRPRALLLTHGHPDHVWTAARAASLFDVPVFLHERDRAWLTDPATGGNVPVVRLGGRILGRIVRLVPDDLRPVDGASVEVGGTAVTALHTPGHTRGSCCFVAGDVCFTGDTVFSSAPGHTGYPGGSRGALRRSIAEKVLPLDDAIRVLPGHGPETTLGRVRPVLERFAEAS